MSFLDLPEVLVGHVKRFHFGALWGSKIGDYIQFPVGGDAPLDLAACASEVEGVALPWDTRYTLFAVVVHKGGFGSGHYVAYVLKNEQWFLFDDESIRCAPAACPGARGMAGPVEDGSVREGAACRSYEPPFVKGGLGPSCQAITEADGLHGADMGTRTREEMKAAFLEPARRGGGGQRNGICIANNCKLLLPKTTKNTGL